MDPVKIFKKLNSRELHSLILMGVLSLCIVVAWFFLSPKGILAYYNLKKQLTVVTNENEQLRQENRQLQEKIEKIQKDPAFLEQVARKEYDLLKKDEILFKFKSK